MKLGCGVSSVKMENSEPEGEGGEDQKKTGRFFDSWRRLRKRRRRKSPPSGKVLEKAGKPPIKKNFTATTNFDKEYSVSPKGAQ